MSDEDTGRFDSLLKGIQNAIGVALIGVCAWLGTTVSDLVVETASLKATNKAQTRLVDDLKTTVEDLRKEVSGIRTEQAKRTVNVYRVDQLQALIRDLEEKNRRLSHDLEELRSRVRKIEKP